jgi:hypothetical protein
VQEYFGTLSTVKLPEVVVIATRWGIHIPAYFFKNGQNISFKVGFLTFLRIWYITAIFQAVSIDFQKLTMTFAMKSRFCLSSGSSMSFQICRQNDEKSPKIAELKTIIA